MSPHKSPRYNHNENIYSNYRYNHKSATNIHKTNSFSRFLCFRQEEAFPLTNIPTNTDSVIYANAGRFAAIDNGLSLAVGFPVHAHGAGSDVGGLTFWLYLMPWLFHLVNYPPVSVQEAKFCPLIFYRHPAFPPWSYCINFPDLKKDIR